MQRKKPLQCKNCKLYDAAGKACTVTVMHRGEKLEMMTQPNDECHWELMGIDVQEIRAWSDGINGYVKTTDPNLEMVQTAEEFAKSLLH